MRHWVIKDTVPREADEELRSYPELTRLLLFNRGIKTTEEAEKFLQPNYERDTHDPFLLLGMDKAVARILKAIKENERIAIFGDYDADGIPGAALLQSLLTKIGHKNFNVYIPDRYEEDYGLSQKAVELFNGQGVKLIITVDCGITDCDAVDTANKFGIDVIITDHHLLHERVPEAYAIINYHQEGDQYPSKNLCGAGTAFKLAQGLIQKGGFDLPVGWEKWLLDLASISTVCDMVPLVGENRTLVYYGLKVLKRTPRVGLQALFRKARVNPAHITEDDIGFVIGPRINIASRMSHGTDALRLLTTDDPAMAGAIVDHLEERNNERKLTVQAILDSIHSEFAGNELPPMIIRGNESWRVGVLGLTANRLMEQYERPVCLWSVNHSGDLKGSMRSDGTVNVLELMEHAGGHELFFDYGGHDFSGGFSLKREKAVEFEKLMLSAYQDLKTDHSLLKEVTIDKKLTLSDVTEEIYAKLEKLSPFGVGNPKPRFLFEGVEIKNIREFGKNGNVHLELTLNNEQDKDIKAIAFFTNALSFDGITLEVGRRINLVASIDKSMFRNFPELRLRIVDLRQSTGG